MTRLEPVRDAAIATFLAGAGFAAARAAPLAEDASFRRYLRLSGGPRPAVLMDAPPGREDVRPFLAIAGHLARLGLSAPAVLAADAEAGLVLIEDLGDGLYAAVLDEANAATLYDAAIDALAVLHGAAPPPGLPRWDGAAMSAAAAATFLDWWWPQALGTAPSPAIRAGFEAALAAMFAPLAAGPAGFVHRDFFAGNLFWLPERAGLRRVGLIDFQDAALGHPAYDLVSLVEDARRDQPEGLPERAIGRYLARRPELDAAAFRAACVICAAQRHLRVAGLWVRLARRDGKPAYLAHGPRTWRRLEAALARPEAAPLADFLGRFVPPERRGNPAGPAA